MAENKALAEAAVEAPPPRPPKRVVAMVLIGLTVFVLVTVLSGGVYFYQRSKVLSAEVVAMRNELKRKSESFETMQSQLEALSRQMALLKEFTVARSVNLREANVRLEKLNDSLAAPTGKANAAAEPAVSAVPAAAAKPATPPVATPAAQAAAPSTSVPAKAKPAKADSLSCDLVGKTPEQQKEILVRCVNVMDTPPPKRRTH